MRLNWIQNRRRGGFTLIELLVAIGLMVILVSAVVIIFARSTQVFATAESLMKIFQNARAGMNVMGREINSVLPLDSGNQKFMVGNPRSTSGVVQWRSESQSVGGVTMSYEVTDPLLAYIGRTAWVDNTVVPAERTFGTAKIWYRLRRDPSGPFTLSTSSVTLERVLLKPDSKRPNEMNTTKDVSTVLVNPVNMFDHLTGKNGGTIEGWSADICQFIKYTPSTGKVEFYVDYYDRNTKTFKQAPAGQRLRFSLGQSATVRQNLPPKIRFRFQVVDNKSNEVRTISREFLVQAGTSN